MLRNLGKKNRVRRKEVHTAAISGETWYKIRGILYQSFCNLVTGGG